MPHVCVLQLLLFSAFRLSSIRTVLLSGFVVLFSHLEGSVLLRIVFIGLLSNLSGSFCGFFLGRLVSSYCC